MVDPHRREDILVAALGAFEAKGILGATLEDIRTGSGASIGSIYHHFGDKEGIAAALHAAVLADYQRGFAAAIEDAGAEQGVRAVVDAHLRWAQRHPPQMRYLLAGPPAGDDVGALNRDFFRTVRAWWARHPELIEFDLATAHAVWLGPATEYCRHWLSGRAPRPDARRRALFSDTAWRSLCRRPPTPS
ncbi:MAG: TetR/AcrR family transcriptional regulator [Solirubrobacteraceae bacterium]